MKTLKIIALLFYITLAVQCQNKKETQKMDTDFIINTQKVIYKDIELPFGKPLKEWIKILGKYDRRTYRGILIWDKIGLGINLDWGQETNSGNKDYGTESYMMERPVSEQETTANPLIGKNFSVYESKEVQRPPEYLPPRDRLYDPTKKHTIEEKKISDHYILADERIISNKHSLIAMYVMLQKAIDNEVPFYENYKRAKANRAKIDYPFKYEIPEKDSILKDYLTKMLQESKKEGNGNYFISTEMYKHICNKYVHFSAHYGGLDALYSKTGDHATLGNYGFINHPVPYTKDENGIISYKRKIYENR